MIHSFQLVGISHEALEPFFLLSDEELLAVHGAARCKASKQSVTPIESACRTPAWAMNVCCLFFTSWPHQPTALPSRFLSGAGRGNAGSTPANWAATSRHQSGYFRPRL